MTNLILVIFCFLTGYLLKRSERFPESSSKVLNGFVIYISLPALVLNHIHSITFGYELVYAAVMPWILFFSALVLFWTLHRFGLISRTVAGVLVLTCGLGNTSFVGIPLIQAYYGSDYVWVGIIADQLGTFLCLGTVGIVFAFYVKEGTFQFKRMGNMIFGFPPSIALMLGFLLRPLDYPIWFQEILVRLGDTLTPLALVSVGLQLSLRQVAGRGKFLGLGLGYKLFLSPLLIYAIYVLLLGRTELSTRVIIFEAGMAPMVTSTIIAIENGIEPELASLILGLGIVASFATSYALFFIL